MKIILEKPDGSPYITMSDDRLMMVSMQIHDYDFLGTPIKFEFDRRTIPALIEALKNYRKFKMSKQTKELVDRITAYLSNGGLFNPELANHDAVRDLLIDCREVLNERKT